MVEEHWKQTETYIYFIWHRRFLSNNHERFINKTLKVESLYYLMKEVRGWKKMVCLVWQWGRVMVERYVSFLGIILDKISEKYDKSNISLYRDKGLSVFKNKGDIQLGRIKKCFQKTFKHVGLEMMLVIGKISGCGNDP